MFASEAKLYTQAYYENKTKKQELITCENLDKMSNILSNSIVTKLIKYYEATVFSKVRKYANKGRKEIVIEFDVRNVFGKEFWQCLVKNETSITKEIEDYFSLYGYKVSFSLNKDIIYSTEVRRQNLCEKDIQYLETLNEKSTQEMDELWAEYGMRTRGELVSYGDHEDDIYLIEKSDDMFLASLILEW